MSDALYARARRQKLLDDIKEKEKQAFVRFAEDYLGAYCGGDCDAMIAKMSDSQFAETIKAIKDRWRKKKKGNNGEEIEEQIEVPQYIC